MSTLALEVTIDEANLILEGLGQLPFIRVYSLITKIQEQAAKQLGGQGIESASGDAKPPAPSIGE